MLGGVSAALVAEIRSFFSPFSSPHAAVEAVKLVRCKRRLVDGSMLGSQGVQAGRPQATVVFRVSCSKRGSARYSAHGSRWVDAALANCRSAS